MLFFLIELRSVFDLFDTNNDGSICAKELMKLMQSCGQNPTEKDVNEIMKSVDKNCKSIAPNTRGIHIILFLFLH